MSGSIDQASVAQTIEVLRQVKPLFENDGDYRIALLGALGVIGGALAAFFPLWWHGKVQRKELRRAVAAQIYAEVKATLQVVRHRRYVEDVRNIVDSFDRGERDSAQYQVHVADDRFPLFKANLQHLALLEPQLQTKIVLFYQLLEAVVQDIKPGGLLNASAAGRRPFIELLEIATTARGLADEVLALLEFSYPEVAK